MIKIFIFAHFGLNIHYSFNICYLEKICLYNKEIILAALLRHNNKTNKTKNRDKIVKSWYYKKKNLDMIFLPYHPLVLSIIIALHCIMFYPHNKTTEIWSYIYL